MTHAILRQYRSEDHREWWSEIVMRGLSLEEAQAHCRRKDTRDQTTEPPMWFDSYTDEEHVP